MIWRLIFGKKRDPKDYSPVDPDLSLKREVIEEAFGQIMVDVDAPDSAKRCLLPSFVKAHKAGSPRQEAEAVATAFEGVEWGEEYFGTWRNRFTKDGCFPYMWRASTAWKQQSDQTALEYISGRYALCFGVPPPPATIDVALKYLSVSAMRNLLIKLDAMPKRGRPRKRQEFVELLCHTGAESEIVQAGVFGYHDHVKGCYARREKEKCELLAHTISSRAGSLGRWYDTQRYLLNEYLKSFSWKCDTVDAVCSVENQYATNFMANNPNRGELPPFDGLPPFFPGDRSSIRYEYDWD